MRMRAVSKLATNPNGHTSNVVSSLFGLIGIVVIVGLIVGMF